MTKRRPPSALRGAAAGLSLLLAALTTGCIRADHGLTGHAVRDSAGITIIESKSPAWTNSPEWDLNADPTVSIGVLDGDTAYVLHRARAVRRLSDGSIVVANGGSNELRAFDLTGRHLWTAGRNGAGPGEFQFLAGLIRVAGDTLLAIDPGLRRMSVFNAGGTFVRSWQMADGGYLLPSSALEDGTLIGTTMRTPEDAEGLSSIPTHLVRFTDGGSRPVELGEITSSTYYLQNVSSSGGSGVRNVGIPFQPVALVAAHARGVYAGNGESYEIRDYNADGTLRRIVRVLTPNPPATAELFSGEVDFMLEDMPEAYRQDARTEMEGLPRIATVPAFDQLVVDAEQYLWVRERAAPRADSVTWSVFHPDGHLLGAITLPSGLHVHEIGSGYVLGVVRDEVDVEQVRMYSLRR